MAGPTRFSDSCLTELLGAFGTDVEYVRAKGDTLFHRASDGTEVAVLDLLSGVGSLILGHNHPELVAEAKKFLDADSPVHTQVSVHEGADEVGRLLNEIIHREFPGTEDYLISLANSGAEAVEGAVKHAEFDRLHKAMRLIEEIEWNAGNAIAAVRSGAVQLSDGLSPLPSGRPAPATVEEFESALAELLAGNREKLGKPPVFFALERSFHGKLVGSVQLTHGPSYRAPFAALGLATRFVPPDQPGVLRAIADEERATVYDVVVGDGRIDIVERDFPVFAALIVEPVQSEGGIHVLTEEFAAAVRAICDDIGCPIIVDEIQSGMGRCGAFFAGSLNGFCGDYFTLSKSLGGGLAKVSATLVRESLYRKEFEFVHSSTFGRDGFSTAIALRTLRLLEADGGKAYERAAERGERLLEMLRALAGEYPDVIADVRGRGLLIGLEFTGPYTATSAIIRQHALSGTFGQVVAGYLLRVHGIRMLPTGSAPNVLRIEPSIYLGDDDIARLKEALTELCVVLRNQDALHLVHPVISPETRPAVAVRDFSAAPADQAAPPDDQRPARKVAVISYLLTPGTLRELDPSLGELDDDRLELYGRRIEPLKAMPPLPPTRIDSPLGTSVELTVFPLTVTAQRMAERIRLGQHDEIRQDIEAYLRIIKGLGCDIAAIGLHAGAVTDRSAVRVPGMTAGSGLALTAATVLRDLTTAAEQHHGGLDGLTLAVLGGAGRTGSTCAALAAEHVSKIVLVGSGRDGSEARLRAAAHRVYQEAWSCVADGGELSGIPALLRKEPLIDGWLREQRPGDEPSGELIARYVEDRYGTDPFVVVTDDLSALAEGHLVLSAVTSPTPALTGEYLRAGAVVCDVAVPASTVDGAALLRAGIHYVRSGILTAPGGASLPAGARGGLGDGELFAGMAEAVVLALADAGPEQYGAQVTRSRLRDIRELARRHGFAL
ncbi:aminotransferase class III-fold pyridoxal phosphate-dependent enzyme [Streptomyces caeruleatus]|uniref:Pyridoxalphosphate dependent aminotransferase, class III n=1 Tax=Streptomyces caeruleatus TaxID=661399 RepID=A0A101TER5_9ACTN|nr:aminotransferase class III-fold pyridoxal phosphate-dependent enzyme [Streptomyces caeruleatus]KUN90897.1 pyridoxalphosphate dependent aminotransferase, class III [Streptomyces caeruleatus]